MLADPGPLAGRADRQGDPRGPARGRRACPTGPRPLTRSGSWLTHEGFLTAADKVHEKVRKDREAKLDPDRARGRRPLRHALDHGRRLLRRGAAHRPPPRRPEGDLVLGRRPRQGRTPRRCSGCKTLLTRPRHRLPRRRPRRRPGLGLGPRQAPGRAGPGRLPGGQGPRHRGPLQPLKPFRTGLDALPLRLPGPARELPARLAPASAWAGIAPRGGRAS